MSVGSGPKIVIVGGGSYTWSPTLLCDMMRTTRLRGSHVVLLDPDLAAADEIAGAAHTMSATLDAGFSVERTSCEASAFPGADFVIITVSTGGLEAMGYDLTIPESYGIFQTVGDTVGPGGWSRTLRNVPVFVHLGQQMERYCPNTVVLNYTNPLATLTGTLLQTTHLRTNGLCHGVHTVYRLLENVLAVQESDLTIQFGGINHFFWVTEFAVRGARGYPLLRDRLGGRSFDETLQAGGSPTNLHPHHQVLSHLFDRYGLLTYEADRHTAEFLPGFLGPTEEALTEYRLARTSIADRIASRAEARGRALSLASGAMAPFARSKETAADIMAALVAGESFVDVVNLQNVGQVDNLPRGCVVETPGVADQLGFRAVSIGQLPQDLAELVSAHCEVQTLTLDAALAGERELALRALLADPACSRLSASDCRSMGAELLAATARWLPQFASPTPC